MSEITGETTSKKSYDTLRLEAARDRVAGKLLDHLQRYTIAEAAAYLRQAISTTNAQISRGDLRVIRQGGSTYVPGSEIARLSSLETAPQSPKSGRGRPTF
jgi:hypothetical protein